VSRPGSGGGRWPSRLRPDRRSRRRIRSRRTSTTRPCTWIRPTRRIRGSSRIQASSRTRATKQGQGLQQDPNLPQNQGPWTPAAPQPISLPPSYDVVDVLRTQHEQVKRLLDQTEAAAGPDRQRHFDDLVTLLERHEKGEREVVHPVTRTTGQDGDQTAVDRLAEERKAEEQIVGLKGLDVNGPEFDAQFARFKSAVLKHAAHEEAEEFPKLRQDIAPEKLRMMAERLLSLQSSLS
jgi:hypothetical protein